MAIQLTRGDLLYSYEDHAVGGDNPAYRGSPDDRRLNRSESYEMLDLLQKLVDDHDIDDIEEVHALEKLVHTKYEGIDDRLSLLSMLDAEQTIANNTRHFRETSGRM